MIAFWISLRCFASAVHAIIAPMRPPYWVKPLLALHAKSTAARSARGARCERKRFWSRAKAR
ncbi:MAG: hypothetical protein R3A52_06785 [Polyangiales bacterium]